MSSIVSQDVAAQWQKELRNQIVFPQQRPIILPGPNVPEPRDVTFIGVTTAANLAYGPLSRPPTAPPPVVSAILAWANSLPYARLCKRAPYQAALNVALINRYNDGRDSMGWHCDQMACLGRDPFIVSLSLGATRNFGIRHNETKEEIWCPVMHGSVVVMLGRRFQQDWKHAVPKEPQCAKERWNLSLRHHLTKEQTRNVEVFWQQNKNYLDLETALNKLL